MATDTDLLDSPSRDDAGELTPDRRQAVALTRGRLDGAAGDVSEEAIWATWERVAGGGPTVGDDLGRVVAELEGIAVDG